MSKIFLIGYMGSGKTTLGKKLSEQMKMSFVDLDLFIEQRQFKTVAQIFEERGESEFRKMEQQALREVCEFEDTIISTGGGVPCFFDNMELMNKQGLTIYLKVTPQKLVENLKTAKRARRPLIKDKSDAELLLFIEENLEKRNPFYSQAKLIIDPDEDIEKIVEKISMLK